MIPIEQYAELCALMSDTGGDEAKEIAIAEANGVSAAAWRASKTGWTAKMSDPADQGRTALAFMPLYQAAQSRARGGAEPCTLEFYAKVKAEMALRKDARGNPLDYNIVLAEHGYTHQRWLECEGYWTPIVGADTILGQPNPKFDPVRAQRFRALTQSESDRILGIDRGAPPAAPTAAPAPAPAPRASARPAPPTPPAASRPAAAPTRPPQPPTPQPAPARPAPAAAPMNPNQAAAASLAAGAKDLAQGALYRKALSIARQNLPRPVYQWLFSGKRAGELAEAELQRRMRNLLVGCLFSLVFGVVFGAVILFAVAIVAWAVLLG